MQLRRHLLKLERRGKFWLYSLVDGEVRLCLP